MKRFTVNPVLHIYTKQKHWFVRIRICHKNFIKETKKKNGQKSVNHAQKSQSVTLGNVYLFIFFLFILSTKLQLIWPERGSFENKVIAPWYLAVAFSTRLISEYCAPAQVLNILSLLGYRYRVTRSHAVFGAQRVNDAIAIQCQTDRIADSV